MSVRHRPPATRSNLLAMARRLERVWRGAALLRRKREALVGELFGLARPALEARLEIAAEAQDAYEALLAAMALEGHAGVEALGQPERELELRVGTRSVWGVEVTTIDERPSVVRTLPLRQTPPTSVEPATVTAATAWERLVERLLDEAPREILMTRLGEELARTTRQVNVLEQRLAPRLAADRAHVRRVLDEREREDHLRLRHLLRRRAQQERSGPQARRRG